MTLPVIALRDRIGRVAKLAFLLTTPDELARGINRAAGLFHDFHDPAHAVIAELAPRGESGVVDRHQSIGSVPLERSGGSVARDAAVQVVGKRAICSASLTRNFIDVVWRGGRCSGRNEF